MGTLADTLSGGMGAIGDFFTKAAPGKAGPTATELVAGAMGPYETQGGFDTLGAYELARSQLSAEEMLRQGAPAELVNFVMQGRARLQAAGQLPGGVQ